MSLRDAMNQRPAVTAGVALLLVATAALLVYLFQSSGGRPLHGVPEQAYFLDTETGTVFADSFTAEPPVTPPGKSEATGVRLHMFACGSCEDESKHFKGYLEMSTEEARQARREMDMLERGELQGGGMARGGGLPALQVIVTRGEQVAAPEAPYKWVLRASAEGQRVLAAPLAKCGSEKLEECFPR